MAFSQLGLSDQLVQGILATGYTAPTEIQSRAIPSALAGKDIIGCAQTGTGKTAAFVLPILNRLSNSEGFQKTHNVKALVLTPTRELAQQIEDSVTNYGRFMKLNTLSIYGGVDIQKQLKSLKRGVDIVIATPGRLLDHISRRSITLSHVEFLVLDEADRMFDMGFINDVKKIIAQIPAQRQTLLFSATMSKEIRALVASIQKNPELIEVGERHDPASSIKQYFYTVPQPLKTNLLIHILETAEMDCVLVFSRTKHGADKIAHRLERSGIKSIAIHSNRTQAQRQRALAGFKQGNYKVLVATDIAARGIDVEGISHVINFDVPTYAEDYIHRIGRTGRASATGDALTFVANEERKHFKSIEHFTGKRFELQKYSTFDYTAKPVVSHADHSEEKRDFRKEGYRNRNSHSEKPRGERSFRGRDERSSGARPERPFRDRAVKPATDRYGSPLPRNDERSSNRPARPFRGRDERSSGGRPPFRDRTEKPATDRYGSPLPKSDERSSSRPERPFRGRDERTSGSRPERTFRGRDESTSGNHQGKPSFGRDEKRPYGSAGKSEKPVRRRHADGVAENDSQKNSVTPGRPTDWRNLMSEINKKRKKKED